MSLHLVANGRCVAGLVACGLLIPLASSGSFSISQFNAHTRNASQARSSDLVWQAQIAQGLALYAAGRYSEASMAFDRLALAAERSNPKISARARGRVGAMQFLQHQYRGALASFFRARRLAESAGDASEVALLDVNLASLYTQMGDLDEAARRIQGTFDKVTGADRDNHLAKMQIQFATIRAQQHRMSEALVWFRRGIDAAAVRGDWALYAIGWNRIGEEYLKAGRLDLAEGPLLEAYRVRKLRNLPLDTSYRNLGRLRLEQGDWESASVMLDRAIELSAQPDGPIPAWWAYHYRAELRLAQGRIREALADSRIAVRLGRAWRWSTPPEDAMRIGAEKWLALVYSARIEAGNRLYTQTADPALIGETFAAADENRANSLQSLIREREAEDFSPSRFDAMQALQRAEVTALRNSTSASEEKARRARTRMAQFEPQSAVDEPEVVEDLPALVRSRLDDSSAILSFQMGDRNSWLWAADNRGIALYPLPPRAQLERLIEAATKEIREDAAESISGAALYQALFGSLAPRFLRRPHWLLALDGALFEVPFAALPASSTKTAPRAGFLLEKHVIEIIPSVSYWAARSNPQEPQSGAAFFLGVGDAIYNTADPRLPRQLRVAGWGLQRIPASVSAAMPRLFASGEELDACARAWNGDRVLLKGAAASRSAIQGQLRHNPKVVHFATHIVPSADAEPQGTIALSLAGGAADLLRPAEIARWRTGADLVVLSGCHSAAGDAKPGTELLGLTRAWLAAGVRNVISSHWAVPDESGSLFAALYRNLRGRSLSTAQALRAAQLEMLRGGGWRSAPQYWGAYFAMGKD